MLQVKLHTKFQRLNTKKKEKCLNMFILITSWNDIILDTVSQIKCYN